MEQNPSAPLGRSRKYAVAEHETRWLLDGLPDLGPTTQARSITDRYIRGTRLRLRELRDGGTETTTYKLSQKVNLESPSSCLVTTMYLTADEHALLTQLPADVLTKRRHLVPPYAFDLFDGALAGLVLAETEDVDAPPPEASIVADVTDDVRFTGGMLAMASAEALDAVRHLRAGLA